MALSAVSGAPEAVATPCALKAILDAAVEKVPEGDERLLIHWAILERLARACKDAHAKSAGAGAAASAEELGDAAAREVFKKLTGHPPYIKTQIIAALAREYGQIVCGKEFHKR